MRDLILKMSVSIDGFVASHDGDNGWMFGGDEAAKAWSIETLWTAGLHIMGSRTFADMAGYWPTSTSPFAPPMNGIPKAVFSGRGTAILPAASDEPGQAGAESWATAHVASGDLADEVAALKARDGAPIIAHGGAAFARALIARGLVDRFALLVHPVALGAGLTIFSDLSAPLRLALVSSTAFPGGAVAQVYRVA